MKKFEKWLGTVAIIYCFIGFVFAFGFAIYYHWSTLSFLSPGFFAVVFSWPIQIPGLLIDLQTYGFTGKPI